MNILETLKKNEPDSLHQELPIVWHRAKDCYVWDENEKKYLDFSSGIFVANVGHGHPKVIKAIRQQIAKPLLHAYTFPTRERSLLVEKLLSHAPWLDSVVLLSTGSETTDAALRVMQLYAKQGMPSDTIGSFHGAYHGNTIGARMLNLGNQNWHVVNMDDGTVPPPGYAGFIYVPFIGWSCKWHDIERTRKFCEQVQTYGGLVAFDVMQSGFGRTGEFWGFEHYGVEPDIICCGKALGGGLPISAIISRKEILDLDDDIWTTHTANPVCCAAALATLDIIEHHDLTGRAKELGIVVDDFMIGNKLEANGKGLIWAIMVDTAQQADTIVNKCAERGLMMIKTRKPSIKIAPPLTISKEELLRGLEIIKECISVTLV